MSVGARQFDALMQSVNFSIFFSLSFRLSNRYCTGKGKLGTDVTHTLPEIWTPGVKRGATSEGSTPPNFFVFKMRVVLHSREVLQVYWYWKKKKLSSGSCWSRIMPKLRQKALQVRVQPTFWETWIHFWVQFHSNVTRYGRGMCSTGRERTLLLTDATKVT